MKSVVLDLFDDPCERRMLRQTSPTVTSKWLSFASPTFPLPQQWIRNVWPNINKLENVCGPVHLVATEHSHEKTATERIAIELNHTARRRSIFQTCACRGLKVVTDLFVGVTNLAD